MYFVTICQTYFISDVISCMPLCIYIYSDGPSAAFWGLNMFQFKVQNKVFFFAFTEILFVFTLELKVKLFFFILE